MPDKLLLDCGLSLVRAQIRMPIRCRKCFEYWHHEDQCRKVAVCPGCGPSSHPSSDCSRVFCTACHTVGHSVKSAECPNWQQARETKRVSKNNNISITATKKIVYAAAPTPTTSAWTPQSQPLFQENATSANAAQPVAQPPPTPAPQQDALMIALFNTLTEITAGIRAQNAMLNQIARQNQEIRIALGNTATVPRLAPEPATVQTPASTKRDRPLKKVDPAIAEDHISPEGKKLKQGTIDSLLRKNVPGPLDLVATSHTVNLGKDLNSPLTPNVATFDMRHIDAFQSKNTLV